MKLLLVGAAASVVVMAAVTGGVYVTVQTAVSGQLDASDGAVRSSACTATVNAPTSERLDQDQLTNAYTIVRVGVSMGVPPRGLVVAIATALQESNLRNLHYGDRDSVGLFQQRPSAGWGTVAQLTDPPTSAAKFYRALLKIRSWESMAVTDAAQAVQISAFPYAYAKWEPLATTLVQQMVGGGGTSAPATPPGVPGRAGMSPDAGTVTSTNVTVNAIACGQMVGQSIPSSAAGSMLQIALAQQGKPYIWGATGPDAFDCSGLVFYAWRRTGNPLKWDYRTSEAMYTVSDRIPAGSEQPGDLLFGDFRGGQPGHVMIVVKPGVAVEAPHTGDVVKVISYDSGAWQFGRLTAAAFENGTIPG